MGGIFFDILEINIVAAIAITLLCILADKLRGRYGAGWMKLAWMLLAVRMLIPYNFSLPGMEIRLLNYAGFEQEDFDREWGTEMPMDSQNEGEDSKNVSMEPESPETPEKGDAAGVMQAAGSMTDAQTVSVAPDSVTAAQTVSAESDSVTHDQMSDSENNIVFDESSNTGSDTQAAPDRNRAADRAGTFFYTRILVIIWIAGVCVGFLYLAGSYLFVARRYRKGLRPVTDAQLIRKVCMQQKRTIGHARLMVYQSAAVTSPCLMGLTCPKLVLPADRSKWKKTELELIMAHEMCHYRNKDLWLKMLMAAVCCVHWFNPFVWLMKKQFFYDMELACDSNVLVGRGDEERENYARVMIGFAGGRKGISAFSTSFGGSRKQMKARIDYMLDAGIKKSGRLSIVLAAILVLMMGIVVSCGYKQGNDGTGNSGAVGGDGLADEDAVSGIDGNPYSAGNEAEGDSRAADASAAVSDAAAGDANGNIAGWDAFDYNHVYNEVLRCYEGDLYLARKDGIYYIEDGQGEETLLYANAYEGPRGMELDGPNLYFCGRTPEGAGATVYRMNLTTHEVVDALAGFELKLQEKLADYLITNVSVYEGNLYVALGTASARIGFALDEKGDAVSQLNDEADDFLYKEYNNYMETEIAQLNSEYDSEEYWKLAEAKSQMYQAVIDVASCKKLLDGRQVVSQYADESSINVYLEDENGTYEYLCNTPGIPMLVTESGIYYQDISMEIWYVDFETKQKEVFYRIRERDSREWSETSLVTYDADYVYMIQHKRIGDYYHNDGASIDKGTVEEYYLIRVSRADGEGQKVYRFPENVSMYGDSGWYRHCGVYNGRMYFDNRESFGLDPDANGMQAVNSGEPCEDAVAIRETIRTFATAYFTNDEETLKGLLTDDFDGTVDLYGYPEQADKIRETYAGGSGMPTTNIDIGVRLEVYYEFTGFAEVEDNTVAYLSMSMIKTQEGFRVQWYGLQL